MRCFSALAAVLCVALTAAPAHAQKAVNEGTVDPFVPAQAKCLMHVRVAELWNCEFGKLLREAKPAGLDQRRFDGGRAVAMEEVFVNYFGTPAEDIDTLWLAQSYAAGFLDVLTMPLLKRGAAEGSPFSDGGGPGAKGEPVPDNAKGRGALAIDELFDLLDQRPLAVATVTTARAYDAAVALAEKHADPKTRNGMVYFTSRRNPSDAVLFLRGRLIVHGPVELIRQGIDAQAGPALRNDRLDTLKKNATKQVWIDWQKIGPAGRFARQQSEEEYYSALWQLKPLQAIKSKQIALQLGPDLAFYSESQFGTADEAEKALPALRDLVAIRRFVEVGILQTMLDREADQTTDRAQEEALLSCLVYLDHLEKALREPKIAKFGSTLTVQVKTTINLAGVKAEARALAKARAGDEKGQLARQMKQSENNLRKIGVALLNFHDTYKRFPPWAVCSKDGKPLLSWRVALLPFLDNAGLYNQFKLDEPWDGPNNRKLIGKMPSVYAAPGVKTAEPGLTYYQGFVGPTAGWQFQPDSNAFLGAQGLRIPASFQDGTSNTIAVIEAGDAVPWTKPADLPYAADKPLPRVGGLFKDGANALLFDGSVRFIRNSLQEATWRAAITPSGGEIMPEEWYRN
jgi:hypothetical protein